MPKSADWLATRTTAETVPCPFCRAPTGRSCRNTYTGREVSFPAHPDRVKLSADRPAATHADQNPIPHTHGGQNA